MIYNAIKKSGLEPRRSQSFIQRKKSVYTILQIFKLYKLDKLIYMFIQYASEGYFFLHSVQIFVNWRVHYSYMSQRFQSLSIFHSEQCTVKNSCAIIPNGFFLSKARKKWRLRNLRKVKGKLRTLTQYNDDLNDRFL